MSASTSILHKRIEIWTSFTPEISNALSIHLAAQGVLLFLSGFIMNEGPFQIVGMSAFAYWVTIFPILWRRPKTTSRIELGLIKFGFVCFLPLSLFSIPFWGWLRELIK